MCDQPHGLAGIASLAEPPQYRHLSCARAVALAAKGFCGSHLLAESFSDRHPLETSADRQRETVRKCVSYRSRYARLAWSIRWASVALLAAQTLACGGEERDCTCAEYCAVISPTCGPQSDCSNDCDGVDETFFNCVCYYRASRPAGSVCDECLEE